MAGKALNITLIEPKKRYTTCFFSNLYLAGLRSFDSLTHGYKALSERYGIHVIHDRAAAVDPAAKTMRLTIGTNISYYLLFFAPGIAIKDGSFAGYEDAFFNILQHALMSASQIKFFLLLL